MYVQNPSKLFVEYTKMILKLISQNKQKIKIKLDYPKNNFENKK